MVVFFAALLSLPSVTPVAGSVTLPERSPLVNPNQGEATQTAAPTALLTPLQIVQFILFKADSSEQRILDVLNKKAITVRLMLTLAGRDGLQVPNAAKLKSHALKAALTSDQGLANPPVRVWCDAMRAKLAAG